jgi:LmbE family N-acetylglucosaminyl deacetylase
MLPRILTRRIYIYLLNRRTSLIRENSLNKSAIVFSPHFDDETLGCGGTIIKKKRAGADVKIVFMTDGSKSHKDLISEDRLKKIRAEESLGACRMLGLNANDVFYLDFEDSTLAEQTEAALIKVMDILYAYKPIEVFIPYSNEPLLWSADHLTTNHIVMKAVHKLRSKTVIYEYPIWFWCHWPRVKLSSMGYQSVLSAFKVSLVSAWHSLRDLRFRVYIGDVLKRKRGALDQYKSQMTRLLPEKFWPILQDVSGGEFLDCFFQDYEFLSMMGQSKNNQFR